MDQNNNLHSLNLAAAELPQPTKEIKELKQNLALFGYCLYNSDFSAEKTSEIRKQIYSQLAAEKICGFQIKNETDCLITPNLLNKDHCFESLVTVPAIDDLLTSILGADFLLSSLAAIQTQPGTKAQGLHFDQSFLEFWAPVSCVANVIWMIEDFTAENGGTRVIPGSHLWDSHRINQHHEDVGRPTIPIKKLGAAGNGSGENPRGTIAIEGKAGTCLILDGRLLHGTGKNESAFLNRTAVIAYYSRPYVRQLFNPFISIQGNRLLSFSDTLKKQLGFSSWHYFMGTEMIELTANQNDLKVNNLIGKL